MNEVMEQSVGRDINDFIAALGPPQQVMEAPGQEGRIFIWTEEHARTIAGQSTSRSNEQGRFNDRGQQYNANTTTLTTYVPPERLRWTSYVMF